MPASPGRRPWILLVFLLAAVAVVRMRLLDVPLERDEGEYAYMGQLILEGVPPYLEAHNMKLPGIYLIYALTLAGFGASHQAIHGALLLANTAATVLVFLLGRRLFDTAVGLSAAAVFASLSLSTSVQGSSANAEHFLLPPALGGLLLLLGGLQAESRWRLAVAGLLLGVAVLIKQHGVFFLAFAAAYLLARELRNSGPVPRRAAGRLAGLLGGAALPYLATCLVLYGAGAFDSFWFWTVRYAREYVSTVALDQGWSFLSVQVRAMLETSLLLWGLALAGLVASVASSYGRDRAGFVLPLSFFSFLAVCPGLFFRPHYFVLLLPAASVLAGVAVGALRRTAAGRPRWFRALAPGLLVLALATAVVRERGYLFRMSPEEVSRTLYGHACFPDSFEIARFIRERTGANDRIAVLGNEPQLYFLAGRRAATGYLYLYPLMEPQPFAGRMQRELAGELTRARPAMVVLLSRASWNVQPGSDRWIFDWIEGFLRDHYRRVGVVDIVWPRPTEFVWGSRAVGYRPRSTQFALLFELRFPEDDRPRWRDGDA